MMAMAQQATTMTTTTTMATTMTMATAMALWAAVRRDMTTTSMATGDADNNVNGNGATGNKVDSFFSRGMAM